MKKRILSMLLCLCMVATLLPAAALAVGEGSGGDPRTHSLTIGYAEVSGAYNAGPGVIVRAKLILSGPEGGTASADVSFADLIDRVEIVLLKKAASGDNYTEVSGKGRTISGDEILEYSDYPSVGFIQEEISLIGTEYEGTYKAEIKFVFKTNLPDGVSFDTATKTVSTEPFIYDNYGVGTFITGLKINPDTRVISFAYQRTDHRSPLNLEIRYLQFGTPGPASGDKLDVSVGAPDADGKYPCTAAPLPENQTYWSIDYTIAILEEDHIVGIVEDVVPKDNVKVTVPSSLPAPEIRDLRYNYDTGLLTWVGENIPETNPTSYFWVYTNNRTAGSDGSFVDGSGRECMELSGVDMQIPVTKSGRNYSCIYKPVNLENGTYEVVVMLRLPGVENCGDEYVFTVPTQSQTTPTPPSDGGGSSGSGGSSSGSSSTSTITVPVSGGKATVQVSASVSGSTATVSKIDISKLGDTAMVEMDFTGLGKTIDTVKLPAAAVKEIASAQGSEGMAVKLSAGEVAFDASALTAIQSQASSQITLNVAPAKTSDLNARQREAVGSSPVFDLRLQSGSKTITDFKGGYATVSLPYTLSQKQDPAGVMVYYLDGSGNIQSCQTMYDVRSKTVIFTTGHFSLYFVGYDANAAWENPFTDVAEGDWCYNAVRFVSVNSLMNGFGGGLFGKDSNLSRAQLAQILYNKEGKPSVSGAGGFTDVASGAWYADAVTWAAANGVVSGYGDGRFGPDDNVTREQLAVMLWRYAGSPAANGQTLDFTDADKISGYALDALRWAVGKGIINGYGDRQLGPQGQATRAQVAQMLMNFLKEG